MHPEAHALVLGVVEVSVGKGLRMCAKLTWPGLYRAKTYEVVLQACTGNIGNSQKYVLKNAKMRNEEKH